MGTTDLPWINLDHPGFCMSSHIFGDLKFDLWDKTFDGQESQNGSETGRAEWCKVEFMASQKLAVSKGRSPNNSKDKTTTVTDTLS